MEDTRFRSSVAMKVIRRYGVQTKTVMHDLGATLAAENILFDAETGDVRMGKTQNGFEEPTYSFTWPAHWAYPGTDLGYKNVGISLDAASLSEGVANFDGEDITSFLLPGDEVMITGINEKGWVLNAEADDVFLVDSQGEPIDLQGAGAKLKVLRSGHKNMTDMLIGKTTFATAPSLQPGSTDALEFSDVLTSNAVTLSDEWNAVCVPEPNDACDLVFDPDNDPTNGFNVNPYVLGLKGNWRNKRTYAFHVDREQVTHPNHSDIRTEGPMLGYSSYWTFNTQSGLMEEPQTPGNWVEALEYTRYNNFGLPSESQNPLDQFSAALFGYRATLMEAQASNSRKRQIAFDGFEDYPQNLSYVTNCEFPDHWSFKGVTNGNNDVTNEEAHTGLYSLTIEPGGSLLNGKNIILCEPVTGGASSPPPGTNTHTPVEDRMFQAVLTNNAGFAYEPCDCDQGFAPDPGQNYVFSGWVKRKRVSIVGPGIPTLNEEAGPASGDPITGTRVELFFADPGPGGGSPDLVLVPTGPVIEGWQKVEGQFQIPVNTSYIGVRLAAEADPGVKIFFDDLRIHPFNSTMNTHVYLAHNLKHVADLDDHNFASVYEYDEEGKLVRVKKETIEGIKTLTETRNSIHPVSINN